MAMNKIKIIGCGPGSVGYLTPLAYQAIQNADVLVGANRLLGLFPSAVAERISVGVDIEKVLDEIEARRENKQITVLVTGDPGLCSLAQPVIRRFGRDACEVIPGVSSIQVAFARLGLDWLDSRIINAHGENPEIDPASLSKVGKIAVLAGRAEAFQLIANLAESIGEGRRIFLCENLTLNDERIREVEPAELGALDAASLSIILLVRKELLI